MPTGWQQSTPPNHLESRVLPQCMCVPRQCLPQATTTNCASGRPPPPRWLSRRGDASGPHGSTYDCKESAVQFCTAHGKYGGTMIDRSMLPDVQEAGALDGLFWTKWSSSSLSGIPNHGIETPPLIRGPYFLIFLAHLQSFWIHAVPPPPPRSARNPSCRLHRSIVTAPPSPRHSPPPGYWPSDVQAAPANPAVVRTHKGWCDS